MRASLLKEFRAQLAMQGQGIGASLLEGGCLRGRSGTGQHLITFLGGFQTHSVKLQCTGVSKWDTSNNTKQYPSENTAAEP